MELNTSTNFKNFNTKETIEMGLDLSNTHGLMNLLRNNIYSDPLSSFVREVYSNAIDAQKRNGSKESIEVSIEEVDEVAESLFTVRDYGNSMNKEVMSSIYSQMGKSDKRDANNEHGGWGLGANRVKTLNL